MTTDAKALYLDAAQTFVDLVERIEPHQWTHPGLGIWDVRALVGHTSRALVTLLSYLDQPATSEDILTPERYYAAGAQLQIDPVAVAERGRLAGAALGKDPAPAVRELQAAVTTRLDDADLDVLITMIAGGMRVNAYLQTRTFELVVHSLDIAAATGQDASLTPEVLKHAAELAARIAVERGDGPAVLQALTGRSALPGGFSVV